VEPVFAYSYQRRILNPDGSARHETVEDYALRAWRQVKGDAVPPDSISSSAPSRSIPAAHVRMQAAAQALIDSSISKTVNVPEDIGFDDFSDVYHRGLPPRVQGPDHLPAQCGHGLGAQRRARRGTGCGASPVLAHRDEALEGTTYKLKWPDSAHAVYVTINNIERRRRGAPVRDLHQFQEYGTLCLDAGADADDFGRVPARRRCLLRRRRTEGRVRSARRIVDERQICALAARRDRR
jgi:hypothetical protein